MEKSYGAVQTEEGFLSQKWDIFGQIYTPLHVTETSFALYSVFPPDTHVPRHLHEGQDEFFHILEGNMVFELDGKEINAGPGTHLTLPKDVPHAIYNRSGKPVVGIATVSPTKSFYEYMQKVDGLNDKEAMSKIAAELGVPFV